MSEVVEVIETDAKHLLVITDKHVYRFNPKAKPLVKVGDVIPRGTPLTDAVQYFECNRGQVPAEIQAVNLPPSFLVEGYYAGVTFINKTVPLVVGSDGIFTTVRFELGGWPLDVDKFWEDIHARGVQQGNTLAHLLDRRTNKVGEPVASNLPAAINPLQFLLSNVFRNHAFIVKVRLSAVGAAAAPFTYLRAVQQLIPPHTAMILIVELEAETELVSIDAAAGTYVETPSTFTAGNPNGELPDLGYTEGPQLYYVDGRCI